MPQLTETGQDRMAMAMNLSEQFSQYEPSSGVRYTMMITICFVVAVTLLGNIGTILAFWKVRGLREKPSNLFILNLSCVDFIMGFVHTFSISTYTAGYWVWGKTGCQIYSTVANIAVSGGLLNTLLICWDRYLLISMPYPKYMKLQSKRRVICIITVLWCYTIIGSFGEWIFWDIVKVPETVYKFDYSQQCRSPPKHSRMFQAQGLLRNIFLPLMLIEGFSIAFVVRLRRKLRRGAQVTDATISERQLSGPSTSTSHRDVNSISTSATTPASLAQRRNVEVNNPQNRYVKAAVTLSALIIALNVCLLPFILYIIYVSLVCPICSNGLVREILSLIVLPLNSCINPILYAITMAKIKQFYLKMFRLAINHNA